jgi:rsbT co-antagonist protein RsbR
VTPVLAGIDAMRQSIARLLTVRSPDEDEQRRGWMVMLVALGLIATSLLLLPLVLQAAAPTAGLIVLLGSIPIYIGVLLLARSGRVTVGAVVLITAILLGIFGSMLNSRTVSFSVFYLALSLLIASLTLRARQIWFVLLADLLGLALVASNLAIPLREDQVGRTMLIGGVIFLGIVTVIGYLGADGMARVVRDMLLARTQAEESAASIARSNAELEQRISERTAALQAALTEVQSRAKEQAWLLSENEQQRTTIQEMSVPVIPVSDLTVIVPLVGALDGGRLAQLHEQTLHAIERKSTRYLILDITGVVMVDSQIAQGLLLVVQSARLLGTEVLLVGIRPEVAQAIVQLGLNLGGVRTFSTLQVALNHINELAYRASGTTAASGNAVQASSGEIIIR